MTDLNLSAIVLGDDPSQTAPLCNGTAREIIDYARELQRRLLRTCTWKCEDFEQEIWESDCGIAWSFIDGGPDENGCNYCYRCGGKLLVARPTKEKPE